MAAKQTSNRLLYAIPYFGGKYMMLKHILPLIPNHRIYLEPFVGGGAVLINKPRVRLEVVNDLDGTLMHLYYVIKMSGDAVCRYLDSITHNEAFFYYAKDYINSLDMQAICKNIYELNEPTELDVKVATYRLILMYNSMLRQCEKYLTSCNDNDFGFNTNTASNIAIIAKRLKAVDLRCADAMDLLKQKHHEDIFVYLDPPYINTTPGNNKAYKDYSKEDMDNLVDWCLNTKSRFLLSNYASILDLYPDLQRFNTKIIDKRKTAGNFGKKQDSLTPRKQEVLIYNYDTPNVDLLYGSETSNP